MDVLVRNIAAGLFGALVGLSAHVETFIRALFAIIGF